MNKLPYAMLQDDSTPLSVIAINESKTTLASSTTPNIFAATTGSLIEYTGTATCTGFVAATQAGMSRTLYCTGAAIFTAGANLLIDGVASGSNLTCVFGDILDVEAITTTQFKITKRTNIVAVSAASCSGNAATATTAASCSGNAATATTATSVSGGTVSATSGTFSFSGSYAIYATNSVGTGIYGGGVTSGTGVYGHSATGVGLLCASNTGMPLRVIPTTLPPSTVLGDGGFYCDSTGAPYVRVNGVWRAIALV